MLEVFDNVKHASLLGIMKNVLLPQNLEMAKRLKKSFLKKEK
jgi:hypothetical protein